MNVWEHIKRVWATSAPPDHPLTEEERGQRLPADRYDEFADAAANFLSHGEADVRGKLH